MQYLGLLRGINVGGKNKVVMSELRSCFEAEGFTDVSTYINSGNIFFSSDEVSETVLIHQSESAIKKHFGFDVVVTVISVKKLRDALLHAPSWWGVDDTKKTRNDALFIIPPTSPDEVMKHLKIKTSSVDRFVKYGQIIFWSLPMEDYGKSVVPKIIGTPVYKSITIRNARTTKKLVELSKSL